MGKPIGHWQSQWHTGDVCEDTASPKTPMQWREHQVTFSVTVAKI